MIDEFYAEQYRWAQGDNGEDIYRREHNYAIKLKRLLDEN